MKLPKREHFTLLELCTKWECSPSEVFHLIEIGRLTPSIFVNGVFDKFILEELFIDGRSETIDTTVALTISTEPNLGESGAPHLYGNYYLCWMSRSGNKCTFDYVSEYRLPAELNDIFKLKTPINVELLGGGEVVNSSGVVFMNEEVDRFETEQLSVETSGKTSIFNESEKLNPKVKTSLLKLIGVMAIRGYGIDINKTRLDDLDHLIKDFELMGVNLDSDIISKYLKQAAEAVAPQKPQ